jgi:hypothetical protein
MTVEELIKELQKFDKDKTVYTEGCDCLGPTRSVALIDNEESVLICRHEKPPDLNTLYRGGRDYDNNI